MQAAYARLHELGWAHSVEVRLQGELVGGLYGVAIGRVFFGESMFSRTRDASKVALVALTRLMLRHGVALIDCQMHTSHLQSLGAATMDRVTFLEQIGSLIHCAGDGRTNSAPLLGFAAGSWRNEPDSILLIQPGTSGPCRN
jgi:leucyl/phenylalanyl-tRNA--protein transferase